MSREHYLDRTVSRGQVSQIFYIAVANAASVACLYLNQVNARDLKEAFLNSTPLLSLLPGSTFLGYASGVALIAFFPRLFDRLTIPAHLVILAGSLAVAGAASSPSILVVASFAIGSGASVAQRLLAAAGTVGGKNAGSVIGTVLATALLAVLTLRIAGSYVADGFGWRALFILSAALVLFSYVLYGRGLLPTSRPSHANPVQVRPSQLWITSSLVRSAAVQHGMAFAAYGGIWMVLFLETNVTERVPIVLGAGLAGTVAAVLVGWFVPKKASGRSAICSVSCLLVATALPLPIAHGCEHGVMRIVCFTIGMALLDAGLQTLLVVNQTRVQTRFPSSRPQVAALLTMFGFTGTAIGSSLGYWSFQGSSSYVAYGIAVAFAASSLICSLEFSIRRRSGVIRHLLRSQRGGAATQMTPASISPQQVVS